MIKSTCLLLFTTLFTSIPFAPQDSSNWNLERDRNGIKVYNKHSEWGSLKAARAEMVANNTNLQAVLGIVTDFDNYGTWFPSCRSAKVLKKVSDNEFIAYLIYGAPWPVADRDVVERVKIDRTADTIYIGITAYADYIPQVKGMVRIVKLKSAWKLIKTPEGIKISDEYLTDPGGSIPQWMINLKSVEIPFDIFSQLKEQIKKK